MTKAFSFIFLIALLSGCTGGVKYHIGVSQCSDDVWREKQNEELRMGAYTRNDVELSFATARDNDRLQVEQIDSLVASGIQLLIVAPNQVSTISSAITRAMNKGIPVIVFERKTNARHTAFVSADNYDMGYTMGHYAATRLKGKGRVLVVTGLAGSSPAIERHKGFVEALAEFPNINIVSTLQGDWTEPTAYRATKAWLAQGKSVDLVFGMNDRTAMGARRAFEEFHNFTISQFDNFTIKLPLFCGVDGLPGQEGGLRLVRDSLLDASYIYPTGGDRIFAVAMQILEGKPFEKTTHLRSAIVTRWNAAALYMQSEEASRQTRYIDTLHESARQYMQQLRGQRQLTYVTLAAILLLIIALMMVYLYFLQRARLRDEREKLTREQLDFYAEASHQLRTPLTLISGPLQKVCATADTQPMMDIVKRNVEQLAALIEKILRFDKLTISQFHNFTISQFDNLSEPPHSEGAAQLSNCEIVQSSNDKVVLIVDDNADVRAYLREILQERYTVIEAANGKEGLETAHREVPDLIVSDVMMPVMNGLKFCQSIKDDELTSHIPMLLLTARALSRHQVEGYRVGADAYLTKPFEPEVLTACMENLLKSRVMLKDLFSRGAAKTEEPQPVNTFVERFKTAVEAHMADSDISVEDLATELCLSRVQLYRKLKSITGFSPVELLRKARLEHAKQLLATTEMSVSEAAYASGFSSPSYFTKCYKDEYGGLPKEVKN